MKKGKVYLIGAGPGDPGLMTLKGRACLKECDVVVYDHLASQKLLDWIRPGCEAIYVGKQAGHHSMKQEDINRLLVEQAGQGRQVARLKGGDPFVFGRGGEEIQALDQAGIPWEVVPGVTSAVAVPECAGIPVTHRGVSRGFHVMTAHAREGEGEFLDFGQLAGLSGTLVFLMGLGRLKVLTEGLIQAGKSPDLPAAVIEDGTLPGQRVVRGRLKDIDARVREAGLGTPAVIVVGETAAMDLSCKHPGIVAGITGTRSFCRRMEACLRQRGIGTRQIGRLLVDAQIDAWADQLYGSLKDYSAIAFTSANGVELFFRGLMDRGLDSRRLAHMKLAVLGPGTRRALADWGMQADLMPEEYSTRGLARLLAKELSPRDRILIPRSAQGSPQLNQILDQASIPCSDIPIYRVRPADFDQADLSGLDYMIFGSASAVRTFFQETGEQGRQALSSMKTAAIGPWTARALEELGQKPDLVSQTFTAEGMAQAVEEDISEI